jgi:hypothetical protein
VSPCIDANVDAKWGSDQWVEGGYSILEQPVFLDRAAYNQGQNAQYKPQITQDGVASSMVARGPAAVMWSASDQAGAERLVESAGTLNCNRGQRGGWVAPLGVPDPAYALSAGNQSKGGVFGSGRDSQDTFVVAFKPSHFTRGKDGRPDEVTPPLSADADKGDQDTVVCATGQITHALTTRAACEEDGTGRGNPIIPTNAVGFNWQNGGGYGKANDGLGITEEGTGPLQRCNTPAVAMSPPQVRRLTPKECEYLQGFPADHTNVTYRNKPAADGPRYRALGNSMAVPCMVWLGHRIHQATKGDTN